MTSRLRRLHRARTALAPLRALSMSVAMIAGGAMAQDRPPLPAVPEDLSSRVVTVRTGSITPHGTRLDMDVDVSGDEVFPAKPRLRRDLLARWREQAAARCASVRMVDARRTLPGSVSSCDVARPVPRGARETSGGVSGRFACETPAGGRP